MSQIVPAHDPVRGQMAVWGLPLDMYEAAQDWYLTLAQGSYYATALKVPFVRGGIPGMIVAVSTPESRKTPNIIVRGV